MAWRLPACPESMPTARLHAASVGAPRYWSVAGVEMAHPLLRQMKMMGTCSWQTWQGGAVALRCARRSSLKGAEVVPAAHEGHHFPQLVPAILPLAHHSPTQQSCTAFDKRLCSCGTHTKQAAHRQRGCKVDGGVEVTLRGGPLSKIGHRDRGPLVQLRTDMVECMMAIWLSSLGQIAA